MFAAAAVGGMMAGAVVAPEPCSAAMATSSSTNGLQTSRSLLSTNDDNNGDERNEGLDQFILANQGGSGDEGNEGDEGNDGADGGDSGSGFLPGPPSCTRRPVVCLGSSRCGSMLLQAAAHAASIAAIFGELCRRLHEVAAVTAAGAALAASDTAVATRARRHACDDTRMTTTAMHVATCMTVVV